MTNIIHFGEFVGGDVSRAEMKVVKINEQQFRLIRELYRNLFVFVKNFLTDVNTTVGEWNNPKDNLLAIKTQLNFILQIINNKEVSEIFDKISNYQQDNKMTISTETHSTQQIIFLIGKMAIDFVYDGTKFKFLLCNNGKETYECMIMD